MVIKTERESASPEKKKDDLDIQKAEDSVQRKRHYRRTRDSSSDSDQGTVSFHRLIGELSYLRLIFCSKARDQGLLSVVTKTEIVVDSMTLVPGTETAIADLTIVDAAGGQ